MRSVYIITSGCYSDYSIHSVSSTKAGAQKVIDAAKTADEYWAADADIETWPVDGLLAFRSFQVWCCGMLLDDGSIVEPAKRYSTRVFARPYKSIVEQCGTKVLIYNNRPIVRVTSSVSQAHANKVAAEARQAWLRKKVKQ